MSQNEPVVSGFYATLDEWKDVNPSTWIRETEKDDNTAFAPMLFTPKYAEAFAYYHAVETENTKRLFYLTTDIVNMNPALYCVWATRRRLIEALQMPLDEELIFLNDLISENPKVYQIWNHRQFVLSLQKNSSTEPIDSLVQRELNFFRTVFEYDAKNYHAWLFLQWLVQMIGLWDHEDIWKMVNELLDLDVRNNSVWNFRMYLVMYRPNPSPDLVFEREVDFVMNAIARAPSNESPWSYMLGLQEMTKRSVDPKFMAYVTELKTGGCRSAPMHSFLVESLLSQGQKNDALPIIEILETEVDTIRKGYWAYRRKCVLEN